MNQTVARVAVPAELDEDSIFGLRWEIASATGDPASRIIVLNGADGIFCRGMSLADTVCADDPAHAVRMFAACLAELRITGKPTIAVVDGEALGGGVGLAAACDLVVATPESSFGLPELLFGLPPAMVLTVIAERMPIQRARLLALLARSVTAERALELGLADEVVPANKLEQTIRQLVRTLSRTDTDAAAELNRYTAEIAGLDLIAGLALGAELTLTALADRPGPADRIRAFLAEGTAPWLAE